MSEVNVCISRAGEFTLSSLSLSLCPQEREMKQLHGLDYVVQQLKSVSLHLVAMESTSDVKGNV